MPLFIDNEVFRVAPDDDLSRGQHSFGFGVALRAAGMPMAGR